MTCMVVSDSESRVMPTIFTHKSHHFDEASHLQQNVQSPSLHVCTLQGLIYKENPQQGGGTKHVGRHFGGGGGGACV